MEINKYCKNKGMLNQGFFNDFEEDDEIFHENMFNEYDPIEEIKTAYSDERVYTKEEAEKNPSLRFSFLRQEWMKAATMKSIQNYIPAKMYMFSILGALYKNNNVHKIGGVTDLRVPIIWFQQSGSGKSQLNKFGLDICRKLGIKAVVETSFTEAGLVGTTDKATREFNLRNSLQNPNDVLVKKNGQEIRFKEEIVKGDLFAYEIIFIDEGKILIQPNRYTEQVLSVLQPAMDFPGTIRKKMAAGTPVEYQCDSTLITTTVAINDLTSDVLDQGFFQRCLFYVRNVGVDDYKEIYNSALCFEEEEYKLNIQNITNILNKDVIERKSVANARVLKVNPEGMIMIKNKMNTWFDIIKERLLGEQLMRAQTFISRFNMFIFKLAGIIACVNYDPNRETEYYETSKKTLLLINEKEVLEAIQFMDIIFNNLMNNIGVSTTTFNTKYGKKHVLSIIKSVLVRMVEQGETCKGSFMIDQTRFKNKLAKTLSCSAHELDYYVRLGELNNYYDIKDVDNTKNLKVIEINKSVWEIK